MFWTFLAEVIHYLAAEKNVAKNLSTAKFLRERPQSRLPRNS